MGIKIDTNLHLLYSLFNVSAKKISEEYSGMSIEEIMEAEAAQGNAAAANFSKEILNNPFKLVEFMQLNDAGNKFAILSNMNERDLETLLPLLSQKDLITGLNFFTKDKLLKLIEKLPKEQLVKFVFEMFSPEHLMSLMPESAMNKVLQSNDMSKYKGMQIKYLQSMKPEILAQMIEAATGQEALGAGAVGLDGKASFDKQALLEQIALLPSDKFLDAMLSMPKVHKQELLLQMGKEDPKIFEMFDSSAFTNIIGQRKEKEEMIKAATAIDSEQLVKMMEQLPKDLTAMLLTQIDAETFAEILIQNYKDILSQIVAM